MNKVIKNIYRNMYLIRKVEEKISKLYHSDVIKSPVHLSIGQESVSVGVGLALRNNDVVFGTYRGHAIYIAKGGNLNKFIAELFGKKSGCSAGKGGSMHLTDKSAGIMGTSAIVSSSIPVALGFSYANMLQSSNNKVVVFIGDGALEEGVFWESLNFASLKNLPILFVCENNEYAIFTHWSKRTFKQNYCERVRSFGINTHSMDGHDPVEVYKYAQKILNKNLDSGPFFLELKTCRWMEHVGPYDDSDLKYRDLKKLEKSKKEDWLLQAKNLLTTNEIADIRNNCDKEIALAFKYAEESEFPTNDDLLEGVYA